LDIAALRREYRHAGLSRKQLDTDPFKQFEQWFAEAHKAGLDKPNALSLATADASGAPSVRIVLLKAVARGSFVFYTNHGSRKAQELEANPRAAMLFHWLEFDRQVRIQGTVQRVSRAESLAYFATRPHGSQLGAWCSEQSRPLESRAVLEQAFERVREKFAGVEVPLPEFWGGYRLAPQRIEFWQGRENRLHDRFEFQRTGQGWQIQRLSP